MSDLSKTTALNFTTDLTIHPTSSFAYQLLSKMIKANILYLSYDYLIHFLNSPSLARISERQIIS